MCVKMYYKQLKEKKKAARQEILKKMVSNCEMKLVMAEPVLKLQTSASYHLGTTF